jgi:hypothetical protein
MDNIPLPKHVLDRAERVWASRLQQDARAWSRIRQGGTHARSIARDGRAIPVSFKRSPRPVRPGQPGAERAPPLGGGRFEHARSGLPRIARGAVDTGGEACVRSCQLNVDGA